jgi:hypothetical protein
MRLAVRLSATLHTVRQVIEAMVEAFDGPAPEES